MNGSADRNTSRISPEHFSAGTDGYSFDVALDLARLSAQAYQAAPEFASGLTEQADKAWVFDPQTDFVTDDRIGTQAFVVAADGTGLLVFRGSEQQLNDWLVNFSTSRSDGPGGFVHRGFRDALDAVWTRIRARLKAHAVRDLWITGHSLGGALAVLAAARCVLGDLSTGEGRPESGLTVRGVYTYGQPRVGDWQFAAAYEDALGLKTFRFVNRDDVVPRVPLASTGFRHVGRRFYFDHRGVLEERDRAADLVGPRIKAVLQKCEDALSQVGDSKDVKLFSLIADHDIAKYIALLENNRSFTAEKLQAVPSRQVIWAEWQALQRLPSGPLAAQEKDTEGAAVQPPSPREDFADQSPSPPESTRPTSPEPQCVGLALSGGGIRSATFNLGVLQALAGGGVLPRIDYLSTVSGGGYIGAWLTAWLYRTGQSTGDTPDLTAVDAVETVAARLGGTQRQGAEKFNDAGEPREVTWLRRFSNYLTPRAGLFSADTLTALATWLRNTLVNQLLLVSALALVLFLAWFLIAALPDTGSTGPVLSLVSGLGPWALILLLTFLAAYSESRSADRCLSGRVGASLVVASLFCLLWVTLPFLLLLIWPAFSKALGLTESAHLLLFIVLAPPVTLLAAFSAGSLLLAVFHQLGGEMYREWWARCNGRLLHTTVVWLAASGITFGTPFLWHLSWDYLMTAGGIAWLATTAMGALSATSSQCSGTERKPNWREWLARAAPYAFIVGLLGLVALGVHWAVKKLGAPVAAVTAVADQATPSASPQTGEVCPEKSSGWNLAYRIVDRETAAQVESPSATIDCWLVTPFADYANLSLHRARAITAGQWFTVFALLFWVVIMLAWRLDINIFSLHFFYRNRLARCYLGASNSKRRPNLYTGMTDKDSPLLCDLAGVRPYPLINCALNITHDPVAGATDRLGWQERKAASFLFSPLHCGYRLAFGERGIDAFQKTDDFAVKAVGRKERLPLAMAITISGAAASPNWGYHTNAATAFLMTVFNARLGWWLPNPRKPICWCKDSRSFSGRMLLLELLGLSSDRKDLVYLSDGGHFENLGLYELVRRRCRVIIASDASQDGDYTFEDLGNAVRKCRTDFGVEIDIDPRSIIPDASSVSACHSAIGLIHYPETEERPAAEGLLYYIKPSLTGDESVDLLQYKSQHQDFPHVSTLDQWFDESQFESYRKLGQHIAQGLIADEFRPLRHHPGIKPLREALGKLRS